MELEGERRAEEEEEVESGEVEGSRRAERAFAIDTELRPFLLKAKAN